MSCDENPDFVLTGKNDDNICCDDLSGFKLSFIDLLANYNERLDPNIHPTVIDGFIGEWLQPQKKEKPNVMPYVDIVDLNNSKEEPHENKPKNSIEVGIKITF